MAQIEKDPAFAAAGLTVLPIVMNTKEQITADMATNGVRTPFLLDDGTVSTAYGTIGKKHARRPARAPLLIDKTGKQRWYGEYPSMWLSNADLLKEVNNHLARPRPREGMSPHQTHRAKQKIPYRSWTVVAPFRRWRWLALTKIGGVTGPYAAVITAVALLFLRQPWSWQQRSAPRGFPAGRRRGAQGAPRGLRHRQGWYR